MKTEILSIDVDLISEKLKKQLLEWSFKEENLKEIRKDLELEQKEHNYPHNVVMDMVDEIDEIFNQEEKLLNFYNPKPN